MQEDFKILETRFDKIDQKLKSLNTEFRKPDLKIESQIDSLIKNKHELENSFQKARSDLLKQLIDSRTSLLSEIDSNNASDSSNIKNKLLNLRTLDEHLRIGCVKYDQDFSYFAKNLKFLDSQNRVTFNYWAPLTTHQNWYEIFDSDKVLLYIKYEEFDNPNDEIRIMNIKGDKLLSIFKNIKKDKEILGISEDDYQDIEFTTMLVSRDRFFLVYNIVEEKYDEQTQKKTNVPFGSIVEIYDFKLKFIRGLRFNHYGVKYHLFQNEFVVRTTEDILIYDLNLKFKQRFGQISDETKEYFLKDYILFYLTDRYIYISKDDSTVRRILSRDTGKIHKEIDIEEVSYYQQFIYSQKMKQFLFLNILYNQVDYSKSRKFFLIYDDSLNLVSKIESTESISSLIQMNNGHYIADYTMSGTGSGNRYIQVTII